MCLYVICSFSLWLCILCIVYQLLGMRKRWYSTRSLFSCITRNWALAAELACTALPLFVSTTTVQFLLQQFQNNDGVHLLAPYLASDAGSIDAMPRSSCLTQVCVTSYFQRFFWCNPLKHTYRHGEIRRKSYPN